MPRAKGPPMQQVNLRLSRETVAELRAFADRVAEQQGTTAETVSMIVERRVVRAIEEMLRPPVRAAGRSSGAGARRSLLAESMTGGMVERLRLLRGAGFGD
jgi:hypothetical protein